MIPLIDGEGGLDLIHQMREHCDAVINGSVHTRF
jgi:hypothetical protein